MQGTSNRTGGLAKKSKLAVDNLATDALPKDGTREEPVTDESMSEPPGETSTNISATGKPATSEPTIDKSYIESPNTVETPKSFGAANLPASPTHIPIEGGGTMGLSPEGDMFPVTHGDGLTILDEYFEESAIGSGSVGNTGELGKSPTFMAESVEPTRPNTPGASTEPRHPPNAEINSSSSEALDVDPDPAVVSAEISESGSRTGLPGSLSTNPTSYPPSETHHINSVWDHDLTEYENFIADHNIKPTSGKSNVHVLRHGLKGQSDRNKSRFVSLVPYEGESGKRTLGARSGSTELLAVTPLAQFFLETSWVSFPGDFAIRIRSHRDLSQDQFQIFG